MTDSTTTLTSVSLAYVSGDAGTTDVQGAYRAIHPSQRAQQQSAAMVAMLTAGATTDQISAWLDAVNSLPAATASRVERLTDDQWVSIQQHAASVIADNLAVVIEQTDGLTSAAYERLASLAVAAVNGASSGSRSATTLVPLAIGDTLHHGDHVVTVTGYADDGTPLVDGVSLSAAAGAITGHPTNGRRYWRLASGASVIAD